MEQPTAAPVLAAPPDQRIGSRELVALLGLSTSLAALGIDSMLPAFADMRADLGLGPDSTAIGATISAFFAGLAVGQLAYGPLSDRYGRRPVLRAGFVGYLIFALAAASAPSLGALVALRFAWGLAAAGPRVVTMAIVRDSYEGAEVSQVMSSLMAVFILVPIIAPLMGAGIVSVASWRVLFVLCALFAVLLLGWSSRLHETLRPEHRMELSAGRIWAAFRSIMAHRGSVGHLLSVTALMTALVAYLSGFESVIDQTYGLVAWFPVLFGVLAAVMGAFMLLNRVLVVRFGSPGVTRAALAVEVAIAAAFCGVVVATDGRPALWLLMLGLAGLLACNALALPNLTALAIEPMGAVAGTAASVIGAIQTAGGALIGGVLASRFDGTAGPLIFGFLACSVAALVAAQWARGGLGAVTASATVA
jgi:DHA1 family bicyclomycin/chloramphenicol resistance-like MFS transporter